MTSAREADPGAKARVAAALRSCSYNDFMREMTPLDCLRYAQPVPRPVVDVQRPPLEVLETDLRYWREMVQACLANPDARIQQAARRSIVPMAACFIDRIAPWPQQDVLRGMDKVDKIIQGLLRIDPQDFTPLLGALARACLVTGPQAAFRLHRVAGALIQKMEESPAKAAYAVTFVKLVGKLPPRDQGVAFASNIGPLVAQRQRGQGVHLEPAAKPPLACCADALSQLHDTAFTSAALTLIDQTRASSVPGVRALHPEILRRVAALVLTPDDRDKVRFQQLPERGRVMLFAAFLEGCSGSGRLTSEGDSWARQMLASLPHAAQPMARDMLADAIIGAPAKQWQPQRLPAAGA